MVFEMYELMDKDEETGVYAILQTITMSCAKIGLRADVFFWMNKQGLLIKNGWNLDKAFKIEYQDWNEMMRN